MPYIMLMPFILSLLATEYYRSGIVSTRVRIDYYTRMLDQYFNFANIIVYTIGIASNSVLICLIIVRTPERLRGYSLLLLISAFNELLISMTGLATVSKLLTPGFSTIFIYSGPCTLIGSRACALAESIFLHLSQFSVFMLLHHFHYRLGVLRRSAPSKRCIVSRCLLSYAFASIHLIALQFAPNTEEELRDYLAQLNYTSIVENYTISGFSSLLSVPLLICLAYLFMNMGPTFVLILRYRSKILSMLDSTTLSVRTREQHRALTKMLTVQSLLPIGTVIGGSTHCVNMVLTTSVLDYFPILSYAMSPALAPWIVVYYIEPYRRPLGARNNSNIKTLK